MLGKQKWNKGARQLVYINILQDSSFKIKQLRPDSHLKNRPHGVTTAARTGEKKWRTKNRNRDEPPS
jgi:hypothetical protein